MPLCKHPDLPGQVVDMPRPRNGWEPLTESELKARAKKKRTSRLRAGKGTPTAGVSTTTKDEE